MPIENIDAIEKSLGLEAGKLSEMFTSEENHVVDLSERVFFSKVDFDSRIENVVKETKFNSVEKAIKDARNAEGLDFQGKTMENLIAALKEKAIKESSVEPEKKYSDLKSNFEKLQQVNAGLTEKFTNLENDIKRKSQERTINDTLLKEIPDNTTIPKDDVLAILKAKYSFNIGEDGFEIIDGGNVLKNETTRGNLSTDEFVKGFIKPYLKQVEGGAGGTDQKGNPKAGSFDAFDKEMESKGIRGQDYSIEMQKRMANGTLKL
jgi:hypothetical protein